MHIPIHLPRPLQEPPETGPLRPQEFPEFQESDLRHLDAGVGFNPPEQEWAAPRSQPVATGGIPEEAQHRPHLALV